MSKIFFYLPRSLSIQICVCFLDLPKSLRCIRFIKNTFSFKCSKIIIIEITQINKSSCSRCNFYSSMIVNKILRCLDEESEKNAYTVPYMAHVTTAHCNFKIHTAMTSHIWQACQEYLCSLIRSYGICRRSRYENFFVDLLWLWGNDVDIFNQFLKDYTKGLLYYFSGHRKASLHNCGIQTWIPCIVLDIHKRMLQIKIQKCIHVWTTSFTHIIIESTNSRRLVFINGLYNQIQLSFLFCAPCVLEIGLLHFFTLNSNIIQYTHMTPQIVERVTVIIYKVST